MIQASDGIAVRRGYPLATKFWSFRSVAALTKVPLPRSALPKASRISGASGRRSSILLLRAITTTTAIERRNVLLIRKIAHVDFEARVVRLDPHTTKNDEGRTFPFTGALERLLERQRAERERLKAGASSARGSSTGRTPR